MTCTYDPSLIHVETHGGIKITWPNGESITYPKTFTAKYTQRNHNGECVPDFRARSAKGEVFFNKYEKIEARRDAPDGYLSDITYSSSDGKVVSTTDVYGVSAVLFILGGGWDPSLPAMPVWLGGTDSSTDAKLLCLANIDSTPYEFAESAAELKKTIEWLRSPFRALRNLAWKFARRRQSLIDKGKTFADATAKTWLEYRFAITPVVIDIVNGIEYANDRLNLQRPKRRTARGRSTDKSISSSVIDKSNASHIKLLDLMTTQTLKNRAVLLYEVTNPVHDIGWELGFTAKDLLPTAWALVPFSFMVDRFLDIGASIKAFQNLADPRVKILGATFSTVRTAQMEYRIKKYQSGDPNVASRFSGEVVKDEIIQYHRDVWVPSGWDAIPKFNPLGLVDSVNEVLDLVAIISGLFRPKRRA